MNAQSISIAPNDAKINISRVGRIVGACCGSLTICLAFIVFATDMQLADILEWVNEYFGITFSVFFLSLVAIATFAIVQLSRGLNLKLWQEVGFQCANGTSTLALTFTLLGISLGIGALSQQSLSPDNINQVISLLTTQFSMAFMTTVLGLPTATAIRAWVAILSVKKGLNT